MSAGSIARVRRAHFVLVCQQALVCAVVGALLVPATGVVTLDIVSPAQQLAQPNGRSGQASEASARESLVASGPVAPRVREVPLRPGAAPLGPSRPVTSPSDRAGARLVTADALPDRLPDGTPAQTAALTDPLPVSGLATVGVTWQHGSVVPDQQITLLVRTSVAGQWSSWQAIPYSDDHAPDPRTAEARGARPGTEPVVVGDVDDVQVLAQTADGSLPPDTEVALIDPGATTAPVEQAPAIDTAALTAAVTAASAGADVTPKPQIYSRAQWGADERMREKSALHYGEVHAGFVHHTVNANGYTRAQVPAILRGIYAYHTQSRGWSDIGYNYLVDRFGRIWEGRYGGVARPVVGAHTLGYNDDAFAMSAIGNFETARPSAAMLDAYGRLFAWKLSLHGVAAGSARQWVTKRFFPAINGHRDAAQTACPGRYLYAQLGRIRSLAASYQHSFASRDLHPQLSGSAWPDLAVRDRATQRLSIVRTGGQTGYLAARPMASGWAGMDLVAAPGDVTGDGYADMVARARSGGTSVFAGTATGALGAVVRTTGRFDGVDLLVGVGDFDGDRRPDLAGRDVASGRLLLYPGAGGGRFGAARVLAASWRGYDRTAGVGDFNGDGHPDLVVRDRTGRLFLVAGFGRAGLRTPVQLPGAWGGVDLVAGGGDVTNDGRPDLVVRAAPSRLTRIYPGDGKGGLGTPLGPFARFRNVSWFAVGGQVSGPAHADVVGLTPAGTLVVFANNGRRNVRRVVRTPVSLAGTNLLLNVGDWNADGYGDVMSRTTDGRMLLRLGTGRDGFAAPVVAATGWASRTQVVSVGDMTGDGHNDLMARSSSAGPFRIYPGDGRTGFLHGYVAHSALSSTRQVAAGLFDADGAPDTLTTGADGSLWLHPGNGPGGMTTGRRLATGFSGWGWLVGLGDLDGDGRSDLLARGKAGYLWMLPGTASGFGPRRLVAAGFGGYDLAG